MRAKIHKYMKIAFAPYKRTKAIDKSIKDMNISYHKTDKNTILYGRFL